MSQYSFREVEIVCLFEDGCFGLPLYSTFRQLGSCDKSVAPWKNRL